MNATLKRAALGARWGCVGLVSGLLSCAMVESRLIYLAREQKTLDHVVWPGIVFALVVLLPMCRRGRESWARTAAALVASSAIYPIAWRIATEPTMRRAAATDTILAFGLAGLLGSFVVASVLLAGRPGWVKSVVGAAVPGTLIGGLMGAHLCGAQIFVSARDGLGLLLIAWQAAAGYALGRGVRTGMAIKSGVGAPGV